MLKAGFADETLHQIAGMESVEFNKLYHEVCIPPGITHGDERPQVQQDLDSLRNLHRRHAEKSANWLSYVTVISGGKVTEAFGIGWSSGIWQGLRLAEHFSRKDSKTDFEATFKAIVRDICAWTMDMTRPVSELIEITERARKLLERSS